MSTSTTYISGFDGFTIVTAFMSQINARNDRPVQKYVDLGYTLLRLPIRQIVFIERAVFEMYFRSIFVVNCPHTTLLPSSAAISPDIDHFSGVKEDVVEYAGVTYSYIVSGHLTFVLFEKCDMYLCAYRDEATDFRVNTPHPTKDTLDYMFVQCQKTEWVAIAIALDRSLGAVIPDAGMYAWLDFGIRHMYPSDIAFEIAIYQLQDRVSKCNWDRSLVYAPSCWDPRCFYSQNVFREIFWVFSGSAFGGSADALLEFAKHTRDKCIWLMTTKHLLMWEVNVWYLVYRDSPELFSLFYGNHDSTIIRKWFNPST
jgi:hypothetical protein